MPSNGCTQEWMQEIILLIDNELPAPRRDNTLSHVKQCRACEVYYHRVLREERLLAGRVRHETASLNPTISDQISITDHVMNTIDVQSLPTIAERLINYSETINQYLRADGKWHVAVAVSILICLLGTFMSFQVAYPYDPTYIAMLRNGEPYTAIVTETFVVDDPNGEFFVFPDESVVYALPNTVFVLDDYPKNLDDAPVDTQRRLDLKFGRLFLDVAPASQGFTVLSANAETKVFGTQFYVHTTRGVNKKTHVAVKEGRVMVEKRSQFGFTVLSDNDMTMVDGLGEKITMAKPFVVPGILRNKLKLFDHILSLNLHETPMNTHTNLLDDFKLQEIE